MHFRGALHQQDVLRAAPVRGKVLGQAGLCFSLVLWPCGFKREA